MVFSTEIISEHIIKPSSPTPSRSKTHKLSFLDQIAPPIYIPLIFFYPNDESKLEKHAEISQLLQQSLSKILTVFYPFAGTIQEDKFVDCNDQGVKLIEARVHAFLAQVIQDPKMEELKQLVPADSLSHKENAILLVKINFFDCGGIAVGVCLSHKVADYASLVIFMNAWAAACRGEPEVTRPAFDLAVYFPPKDWTSACFAPDREELATKRLVFDKEMLETLKQQAAGGKVKNPTRVEALSVYIYQQFIQAYNSKSGSRKTSFAINHSVNLRPRTIPPIPNHTIGSCSSGCFAFTSESTDRGVLLSKLRAVLREQDDEYIKKVISNEEYLKMIYKAGEKFMSGTVLLIFTSWCRFPAYEVDFGWGKPVWVGAATMPYKNTIVLMDTPSGDGIEAWVNMPEDLFQILKANYNKLKDLNK